MAAYSPPPAGSGSSSNTTIIIIVVVGVFAFIVVGLLALGAIAFFGARSVVRAAATSADGGTTSGAGAWGLGGGEQLTWDASGGISVLAVDVNGDGVEDFVGRFRLRDGSEMSVYVGAFDGKTFTRIWKAGPYGTTEQAANGTPIALAGSSVAVADYRATVHVLDLKTGAETSKLTLSDRAKSICSPADGRSSVWIEVSDRQNVVADLTAATATPTPARPAWCGPKDALFCAGGFGGIDGPCGAGTDDMVRFQSSGLTAMQVVTVGGDGVALGIKTPGTPSLLAVGFDAKTRAVRWHGSVAPDPLLEAPTDVASIAASLAGGRLYTAYSTTSPAEAHIVALDAATGARLIDAKLPHVEDGGPTIGAIVVSATRIYVAHWMWLDVLDAATGKVVGTLGTWPG